MTKKLWGENRVTIEAPDGALRSVPVGWTDLLPADPVAVVGRGRAHFRLDDLVKLVELIAGRTPK